MRALIMTAVLLCATFGSGAAQQRIDERVPSGATGSVKISNLAGSVSVTGWDRNEIRVTGTLGRGAERLDISGGGNATEIKVVLPRQARNVQGTDLRIQVPRGKTVAVQSVSADIAFDGVAGAVRGQSVSGDVTVAGSPADIQIQSTSGDLGIEARGTNRVRARTTSGDVQVTGSVGEVVEAESTSGRVEVRAGVPESRVKTVSGGIVLRGVSGRVSAGTVSGSIDVSDSRIRYGDMESVSGRVRYEGALERDIALTMESHSGSVELAVPSNVAADFEVSTFSGEIRNDFGQQAQRTSRYTPGRELKFSQGGGGGLVVLKTFSGQVKLLRR